MAEILRTVELTRHFGGITAVARVSLSFEANQLRSVIGSNGAGKTTLFNLLTGRLPATSGRVLFEGRDITNWPPHKIVRLGVCRTFQRSSVFFGLTVFENVRIAVQAKAGGSRRILASKAVLRGVNERAWGILEQLGLTDQAEAPARTLSHGDQRVLEVGIALAGEPRILLLDEPTAGMSPAETERTTKLIRRLADEIAVVLVEHDMDVVMSISDRISVMHQGRIIAEGTPEEIRRNEEVREAYLGRED
jgi:branched-chain amino acid transport system ATP-binding protein